ncbi:hypothetical protein SGPA1_30022 [Streptomyces misionensis JCM 4497]
MAVGGPQPVAAEHVRARGTGAARAGVRDRGALRPGGRAHRPVRREQGGAHGAPSVPARGCGGPGADGGDRGRGGRRGRGTARRRRGRAVHRGLAQQSQPGGGRRARGGHAGGGSRGGAAHSRLTGGSATARAPGPRCPAPAPQFTGALARSTLMNSRIQPG